MSLDRFLLQIVTIYNGLLRDRLLIKFWSISMGLAFDIPHLAFSSEPIPISLYNLDFVNNFRYDSSSNLAP
jgi:hypothetical protein